VSRAHCHPAGSELLLLVLLVLVASAILHSMPTCGVNSHAVAAVAAGAASTTAHPQLSGQGGLLVWLIPPLLWLHACWIGRQHVSWAANKEWVLPLCCCCHSCLPGPQPLPSYSPQLCTYIITRRQRSLHPLLLLLLLLEGRVREVQSHQGRARST
jgi:hypothetical protein